MSTPLEAALSAWLVFLGDFGVDLKPQLLPGATDAQIASVEKTLGKQMPDDWQALYRIANGQLDPYENPDFDQPYAPLFGNYPFLSLEGAAMMYEGVLSTVEFMEDDPSINEGVDVREGDPIRPVAGSRGWWPIGGTDSYVLAVDLDPPREGTYGQVVSFDLAGPERHVLADSITSLLRDAASRLDKSEKERYQISEKGQPDNNYTSVWFDIDWRVKPYSVEDYRESIAEMPPAYKAWVEKMEAQQEERSRQFADWLSKHEHVKEHVDSIVGWISFSLRFEPTTMPPANVLQEMDYLAQSLGQIPLPSQSNKPNSIDVRKSDFRNYYMSLARVLVMDPSLSMGGTMLGDGGPQVDEIITLYHQYHLESDTWSEKEFESANAMRSVFENLSIGEIGFGTMEYAGTELKICYMKADQESADLIWYAKIS